MRIKTVILLLFVLLISTDLKSWNPYNPFNPYNEYHPLSPYYHKKKKKREAEQLQYQKEYPQQNISDDDQYMYVYSEKYIDDPYTPEQIFVIIFTIIVMLIFLIYIIKSTI